MQHEAEALAVEYWSSLQGNMALELYAGLKGLSG